MATVFVTGGTGYMGVPLIRELLRRGHTVRALVRTGTGTPLAQMVSALAGAVDDPARGVRIIEVPEIRAAR